MEDFWSQKLTCSCECCSGTQWLRIAWSIAWRWKQSRLPKRSALCLYVTRWTKSKRRRLYLYICLFALLHFGRSSTAHYVFVSLEIHTVVWLRTLSSEEWRPGVHLCSWLVTRVQHSVYHNIQKCSLWIKPTDALNSNVIGITTLYVSGGLSAHHQKFLDVHRLWYILCSCDDRLLPGVGWNWIPSYSW